jgi:superfamily I DNA/RNA helicase
LSDQSRHDRVSYFIFHSFDSLTLIFRFDVKTEIIKEALLGMDRQVLQREWPGHEGWEMEGGEEEFARDDGPLAPAISYFISRIARAKRNGHSPARYQGHDRTVMEHYEQRKRSQNCIDQDDSVPFVVKLFSSFPAIISKYRDNFRFILVDEFQVSVEGRVLCLGYILYGIQ